MRLRTREGSLLLACHSIIVLNNIFIDVFSAQTRDELITDSAYLPSEVADNNPHHFGTNNRHKKTAISIN